MALVDPTGEKLILDGDGAGLVRLDGVPVCRRIERDGVIYLEFFDRDRLRAGCRKTPLVQIPLLVFCEALSIQQEQT